MNVTLDRDWLDANPLTLAGLERERKFLADAGITLTLEIVGGDLEGD